MHFFSPGVVYNALRVTSNVMYAVMVTLKLMDFVKVCTPAKEKNGKLKCLHSNIDIDIIFLTFRVLKVAMQNLPGRCMYCLL